MAALLAELFSYEILLQQTIQDQDAKTKAEKNRV